MKPVRWSITLYISVIPLPLVFRSSQAKFDFVVLLEEVFISEMIIEHC